MAYIYKITNDINDKIYIGKTEFSIEKRWKEHCKDRLKNYENRPLYSAMNKYGVEHFHIEMIEETDCPEEKERYWIEYYGSFKKGYNATKGGDGKPYLDYELICKVYNETKNVTKTSEIIGCSRDQVRLILDKNGINEQIRRENKAQNCQKPVARLDPKTNEILEVFSSIKEAYNKYPNTNKHIPSVCKGKRKTCGGYGWKYL